MANAIVIKPVVTEKSSAAYALSKVYTFKVDVKASKPAILQAIQQMFGVTVDDRDHVFSTRFSFFVFISWIRASRRSSTNGPFLTLRAITGSPSRACGRG